jgi:hypothetical protein
MIAEENRKGDAMKKVFIILIVSFWLAAFATFASAGEKIVRLKVPGCSA